MEKSLGKRIQSERKKLSLTQEQLAEKMGVSGQAVSKWESDISCPDITLIPLLADLFGMTSDELLRGQSGTPEGIVLASSTGKSVNEMNLKILVDAGGTKVKINTPIQIIKALISSGMDMNQVLSMQGAKNEKANASIDFDAILRMVDSGLCGNLMNIEVDDDGELIAISILVE